MPPLALIAVLTLTSGGLLDRYSDAAYPYADSFTTWAAMITTWMVARKVLQNWHYWFVIDVASLVGAVGGHDRARVLCLQLMQICLFVSVFLVLGLCFVVVVVGWCVGCVAVVVGIFRIHVHPTTSVYHAPGVELVELF